MKTNSIDGTYKSQPSFGIHASIIKKGTWTHTIENETYNPLHNVVLPMIREGLEKAGKEVTDGHILDLFPENELSGFCHTSTPAGMREGKPVTMDYMISYEDGNDGVIELEADKFASLEDLAKKSWTFLLPEKLNFFRVTVNTSSCF